MYNTCVHVQVHTAHTHQLEFANTRILSNRSEMFFRLNKI